MNSLENETRGHVNGAHATNWAQACDDAEHETDPTKLLQLLAEIENRIFLRLQELGAKDFEEHAAIEQAVVKMRRLQVERLNFPKSEMEVKPLEELESSRPSGATL
jgi:hypothetical protein